MKESEGGHKYGHTKSKTTIEIDDAKLERVMQFGGFTTRKEAVDRALTEAVRRVTMNRIAESPWSAEDLKDAINPEYDVMAVRRQDAAKCCAGLSQPS